MNYFRFNIAHGIVYSPGWHGQLDRCPDGVKVLLYNDAEGYGIAQTEDAVWQKELTVLGKEEAERILAEAKDEDGVYFGDKLEHRWDVKPEPEVIPVDPDKPVEPTPEPIRKPVEVVDKFCPICHKNAARVVLYDDKSCVVFQEGKCLVKGLIAKNINVQCPAGHTVKVVLEAQAVANGE